MEGTQATAATKANQAVTASERSTTSTAPSDDFLETLKGFLGNGSANEISEEDLFAAVVKNKIKESKGEEALAEFQEFVDNATNELRRPDGFVSHEDVTKAALKECREAELLTSEETDSIYSESFAAAQLDGNKEALFDDRGGETDSTKAVSAMEAALLGARTILEGFSDGTLEVESRSVDEASFGHNGSGSTPDVGGSTAGFLWKPESDSDGKLAVLLPTSLAGQIQNVVLKDSNDTVLEEGRYAGNGNGGRDHYRFNAPGGSYPNNSVLQVTLKSGEVLEYLIDSTSSRLEDLVAGGSDRSSETDEGSDDESSDPSSESTSAAKAEKPKGSNSGTSKTEL